MRKLWNKYQASNLSRESKQVASWMVNLSVKFAVAVFHKKVEVRIGVIGSVENLECRRVRDEHSGPLLSMVRTECSDRTPLPHESYRNLSRSTLC